MVGWYRHDIPAWMDGTEGLTDGQYRTYHVVCQLIYLNEGSVVRNDRGIAGRCNQTVKAFSKNLDVLIELGKIILVEGKLFQARAGTELTAIMQNRENAGKGGRTSKKSQDPGGNPKETEKNSGNATSKPLENKAPKQAALKLIGSLEEERRGEECRLREEARDREAAANRASFPEKAFDVFWHMYPEHVGTLSARKAFEAVRISGRVAFRTLMEGLARYKATKPKRRAWCNPTKWLEEGRWDDRIAPSQEDEGRRSASGFSELAARKVSGDDSAYHDPYQHLDRPGFGRAG